MENVNEGTERCVETDFLPRGAEPDPTEDALLSKDHSINLLQVATPTNPPLSPIISSIQVKENKKGPIMKNTTNTSFPNFTAEALKSPTTTPQRLHKDKRPSG